MPVHGIRLDLELLAIVTGAALISFFATGRIVSNVLFTTLIATLFFLMGLHIDLRKMERNVHKRKELLIGLGMVFIVVPSTAFLLSQIFGGVLGEALIAIGVSTAAIGSPVVWSNIGKGEGGTALIISMVSLFLGIALIPILLLGFSASVPVIDLLGKNILVLGLPLAFGAFSQRYHNKILGDMKHHFSKLALWLIVLITAIQFQLVYQTHGLSFLSDIMISLPVLTGFTLFTFMLGYGLSKDFGVMERKARSIGFVSGSKGIAVALFVAAQFSGEAVVYVSLYYFVRQAVCGVIAEFFKQGYSVSSFFNSLRFQK